MDLNDTAQKVDGPTVHLSLEYIYMYKVAQKKKLTASTEKKMYTNGQDIRTRKKTLKKKKHEWCV